MPKETLHVLTALRNAGKKLGLISNIDVIEAEAWERSPMAALFDSMLCSRYAGWIKSQRKIYEACMAELQVAPKQFLFVEDGGTNEP
jgi:FMN phosphatase YigB (HAD superfamily)